MEEHKWKYITYVLIVCVIAAGLGGYYIGKQAGRAEGNTCAKNSKCTNEVDETINDDDIALIESEVGNLFSYLNGTVDEASDKCTFLASDYYNGFINVTGVYDFNREIAPSVMECLHNEEYIRLQDELPMGIISEEQYKTLQKYFNVEYDLLDDVYPSLYKFDGVVMDEYLNNNYHITHAYPSTTNKSNLSFTMGNITPIDEYYQIEVEVANKDDENVISRGEIIVKVIDDYVYYDNFLLNLEK